MLNLANRFLMFSLKMEFLRFVYYVFDNKAGVLWRWWRERIKGSLAKFPLVFSPFNFEVHRTGVVVYVIVRDVYCIFTLSQIKLSKMCALLKKGGRLLSLYLGLIK